MRILKRDKVSQAELNTRAYQKRYRLEKNHGVHTNPDFLNVETDTRSSFNKKKIELEKYLDKDTHRYKTLEGSNGTVTIEWDAYQAVKSQVDTKARQERADAKSYWHEQDPSTPGVSYGQAEFGTYNYSEEATKRSNPNARGFTERIEGMEVKSIKRFLEREMKKMKSQETLHDNTSFAAAFNIGGNNQKENYFNEFDSEIMSKLMTPAQEVVAIMLLEKLARVSDRKFKMLWEINTFAHIRYLYRTADVSEAIVKMSKISEAYGFKSEEGFMDLLDREEAKMLKEDNLTDRQKSSRINRQVDRQKMLMKQLKKDEKQLKKLRKKKDIKKTKELEKKIKRDKRKIELSEDKVETFKGERFYSVRLMNHRKKLEELEEIKIIKDMKRTTSSKLEW